MTLDALLGEWEADSKIDIENLELVASKVPYLHAKWWRHYTTEKLRYKKLSIELGTLKHNKHEWFAGRMVDETRLKLGWGPQPLRLRIREDIERHVNHDPDVMKASAGVALQEEIVRFLEGVIKSINDRGYLIRTTADYLKFKMGM